MERHFGIRLHQIARDPAIGLIAGYVAAHVLGADSTRSLGPSALAAGDHGPQLFGSTNWHTCHTAFTVMAGGLLVVCVG